MKKKPTSKTNGSGKPAGHRRVRQAFPAGWDEKRVRALIEHYDRQTDDERADEIERAAGSAGETLMSVPTALVPEVLKLIERRQKSA
jgi:hypothetical protein